MYLDFSDTCIWQTKYGTDYNFENRRDDMLLGHELDRTSWLGVRGVIYESDSVGR